MPIEKCSAVPTETCSAPDRRTAIPGAPQGPDSGKVIDVGITRTIRESLLSQGLNVTHAVISTTRRVVLGPADTATRRLTRGELAEAYEQHRAAVDFALESVQHGLRGICTAGALGAIARAYYWAQKEGKVDKLRDFCRILSKGEYSPADGAEATTVLNLRKHLLSHIGKARGTRLETESVYHKMSEDVEN